MVIGAGDFLPHFPENTSMQMEGRMQRAEGGRGQRAEVLNAPLRIAATRFRARLWSYGPHLVSMKKKPFWLPQEPLAFLHIDVTEVPVLLRKFNKRQGCGSTESQGHNRLVYRHGYKSRKRDDTTSPWMCCLGSRVENCVLSPAGHFLHVQDVKLCRVKRGKHLAIIGVFKFTRQS